MAIGYSIKSKILPTANPIANPDNWRIATGVENTHAGLSRTVAGDDT